MKTKDPRIDGNHRKRHVGDANFGGNARKVTAIRAGERRMSKERSPIAHKNR
jgi:hypothetical protein